MDTLHVAPAIPLHVTGGMHVGAIDGAVQQHSSFAHVPHGPPLLDEPEGPVLDALDALVLDALEALELDALEALVLDALEALVLDALEALVLDALEALVLDALEALVLDALEALVLDAPEVTVLVLAPPPNPDELAVDEVVEVEVVAGPLPVLVVLCAQWPFPSHLPPGQEVPAPAGLYVHDPALHAPGLLKQGGTFVHPPSQEVPPSEPAPPVPVAPPPRPPAPPVPAPPVPVAPPPRPPAPPRPPPLPLAFPPAPPLPPVAPDPVALLPEAVRGAALAPLPPAARCCRSRLARRCRTPRHSPRTLRSPSRRRRATPPTPPSRPFVARASQNLPIRPIEASPCGPTAAVTVGAAAPSPWGCPWR